MALDKELKERWTKALRSGEYRQTRDTLEDSNGCNCCLGVLANVEGVPKRIGSIGSWKYVQFEFGVDDLRESFPPDDWKGLDSNTIAVLSQMNDTGSTFAQIADYIEENL